MKGRVLLRSLATTVLACTLAMALAVPVSWCAPIAAWGVTEEVEAQITEAQRQIEESAAAYDAAVARIAELEQQIAENEQRVAELQKDLPAQQERSDNAVAVLYKMNREGHSLLNMILASESIVDFLKRVDYLSRYQERNLDAIRQLQAMEQELSDTQASLGEALSEARQQEEQAEVSLAAAQQAREQAQKEAQEQARREREAQEAARRAAEEAARKAAEEQQRQEDEAAVEAPAESGPAEEEPPSTSPSDDGADWSNDKASFVNEWAPRINRYLSGSPLAGTGETFAVAAWDYGVDPRWSPAISAVESSKGAACFKPHNAWGWGSSSWDNWDDAIRAHVSGLARGYGYTLSESAAKKYCPPNWQHWYDRCAEEMNSI